MSYQVLARKWRPETFNDLVGQEHVLQALIHGLRQNRLHHAYLFTGTRGVGKTTIGRILARCLNCETGVTPEPCGTCGACTEIREGRFVDLIEIDAASRTKVEDMRELLDNVQYAPTRGRFKIYLIDEVHMLSNSSFNALLKTLEEPPAHVKFLFATTDPQKLPVTILSRCLQFNLKQLTPERIVSYLQHVLPQEDIPYEDAALWLLARAADGSMRDALSLTDQAIAFSNQSLQADQVSTMLGTIDRADVFGLLEPLLAGNGQELLARIGRIADFAPDFAQVLSELLSVFHRISLEQCVPGSVGNALGDEAQIQDLARRMSAEDTQLFYQTALLARKDLAITPDARMGFEMALLRMLAFRPGTGEGGALGHRGEAPQPASAPEPQVAAPAPEPAPVAQPEPEPAPTATESASEASPSGPESVPLDAYADALAEDNDDRHHEPATGQEHQEPPAPGKPEPVLQAPEPEPEPAQPDPAPPTPESAEAQAEAPAPGSGTGGDWAVRFEELGLQGMAGNLASQAAGHWVEDRLELVLDENHTRLLNDRHKEKITEAVKAAWGASAVSFTTAEPGQETPAAYRERKAAERQQQAVESIQQDPVVQKILEQFDGRIIEESIRPL